MRIPVDNIRSPSAVAGMVRGVFYGWWLVGIAVVLLTIMAVSVFQGLGHLSGGAANRVRMEQDGCLSGAFSLSRRRARSSAR